MAVARSRMTRTFTIFSRELAGYFATPLAYVFIVIFLVLAGVLTFFVGDFFERGQADLQAFFTFHPWLYLVLVPALSMRLWAEERKTGTIELFLTLPIRLGEAVLGKFLAAWFFAGIALALTFPFWLTVNFLGEPDNGVILAGYSRQLADGRRDPGDRRGVSALTKNQVIAFVVTAALVFLLTAAGTPAVLGLLQGWAPERRHRRRRRRQHLRPFRRDHPRRHRSARPRLFPVDDGRLSRRQRGHRRPEKGRLRCAACFAGLASRRARSLVGLLCIALILVSVNILAARYWRRGSTSPRSSSTRCRAAPGRRWRSIDEPITLRFYYSTAARRRGAGLWRLRAAGARAARPVRRRRPHGKLRLEVYQPAALLGRRGPRRRLRAARRAAQ